MAQQNDASYKRLFSYPQLVRDLVLGFIPDDWLHALDYRTLEKVSGEYVADDGTQRRNDVVWRVRANGEWLYLYLMIEFQSSVDAYMAVRMMNYVSLLYQRLIGEKLVLPDRSLPPVLPIVLYNGERRWTAATEVETLIAPVPGIAARYQPRLAYLLLDESRYSDEFLAGMKNVMAVIMRLEHSPCEAEMEHIVDQYGQCEIDNPELEREIVAWTRDAFRRQSGDTLLLPAANTLKELKMSMSQRFERWAHQHRAEGEAKGKVEGKVEGEAAALQKLLARRFGPLPSDVIAKIEAADLDHIELWLDQVLDAGSLDDVFRP